MDFCFNVGNLLHDGLAGCFTSYEDHVIFIRDLILINPLTSGVYKNVTHT